MDLSIFSVLGLFVFTMILIFMLYFVNTLYYISVLVFFFLILMSKMVFSGLVSSMFGVLVALVYIGAMMIFIGYVCAISPNLYFAGGLGYGVSFSLGVITVCFTMACSKSISFSLTMADFFYSSYGGLVLGFLVYILLLTLIMVSSQYFFPKGPFRSF